MNNKNYSHSDYFFKYVSKFGKSKRQKIKWNLKNLIRLETDLLFPKVKSKKHTKKMVTQFPKCLQQLKNKSTLHYDI